MTSPFPGMDPFLESPEIWEDFHASLAWKVGAQLAPRLRPRYFTALTPRVTYEELTIERVRAVKPDVSVIKASDAPLTRSSAAIAPAPVTGLLSLEVPMRLHSVEVRETETGRLVTVIEILSPVNNRPGHEDFEAYRRKRRHILGSSVHLMEVDLLRQGQRPPLVSPLPVGAYFVFLSREDRRPEVEIWPIRIQDPLPIVPVPLLAPDPDVPLDLGDAIHSLYSERSYDLRIDYTQPPPAPDLSPEDARWVRGLLSGGRA